MNPMSPMIRKKSREFSKPLKLWNWSALIYRQVEESNLSQPANILKDHA